MVISDKDIIRGVTQTLKKVTFSSSKAERFSQDHLITMNVPVIMARRDAAYDRAVYLLGRPLFSFPEKTRSELYGCILKLLNIAIEAGRSISLPYEPTEKQTADPINQYLLLLIDTVQAAFALVNHELILFQEKEDLSHFIGKKVTTQIKNTDEIFCNSEMNIYHCINELIELSETAMTRFREGYKRSFSKENRDRYEKSLKESTELYRKIGESLIKS